MRRPPVSIVVIAVSLTGVSVAWAARPGAEPPSARLLAAPGAADLLDPDPSSGREAAPADQAPEPSVERVVESVVVPEDERPVAVRDPAVLASTPPDHLADQLDVDHASLELEPIRVVTTTTSSVPPSTTASPTVATTRTVSTVAFTATQAYGSCEEPIPYDIFSGTADPGSAVTISSSYGSGTTVADGSGHWERKVEFPAAPRGETFAVTASGPGGSVTMSFTATGSGHA